MNIYLLGLGSNISPQNNLNLACNKLRAIGDILSASPVLITAPVGHTFSDDFGNQLVVVASQLPPTMLKHQLLNIEMEMGREPKSPARKTRDRTIDIDILQQLQVSHSANQKDSIQSATDKSLPKASLTLANTNWATENWQITDSYYLDVLQHWRQQQAA